MSAPLPSAVRVPFRAGAWRGEVAADLAPHLGRLGLTEPETLGLRAVARAQGRGQALTIPLDEGHGVFRRYLHGGLLGAFTGDLFRGRRSLDEVRVLARLRAQGAPCPEPLAAYEQEVGLGFRRMAILTRAIPGARAAPEALRALPRHDVAGRRRMLRALALAVRAFHDAGGDHADLNARNLVVDPEGRAWVLDLDRGVAGTGPAPAPVRVRNLLRLARSWRKLDPAGTTVTPRDALAFCRAYAGGHLRGLPPGVARLGRTRRDLGGVLYEFASLLLLPVIASYLLLQRLTGGRLANSIPAPGYRSCSRPSPRRARPAPASWARPTRPATSPWTSPGSPGAGSTRSPPGWW
jgi:3-deoxy-D-manno-octulosonic acid kinase